MNFLIFLELFKVCYFSKDFDILVCSQGKLCVCVRIRAKAFFHGSDGLPLYVKIKHIAIFVFAG